MSYSYSNADLYIITCSSQLQNTHIQRYEIPAASSLFGLFLSLVIGSPSSGRGCGDPPLFSPESVSPSDPLLSFSLENTSSLLCSLLLSFPHYLSSVLYILAFSFLSSCGTEPSVSGFFLPCIIQSPHKIALLSCIYSTFPSSGQWFVFQRRTADMLDDAHTEVVVNVWLHGQKPNDPAWFNRFHITACDSKQ